MIEIVAERVKDKHPPRRAEAAFCCTILTFPPIFETARPSMNAADAGLIKLQKKTCAGGAIR